MSALIGKTPFFRLLLSVVTGIVVCSFFPESSSNMFIPALLGVFLMLFSFFIPQEHQFKLRWLFGAGVFLFLFSLSSIQYRRQEQNVQYTFTDAEQSYIGTITSIPEIKPHSVACNLKTVQPIEKKVVLYFEQTDEAWNLKPGDEIVFTTTIEPFRNLGNPDDFDYVRFMKIKGFSGSSYIRGSNWQKTGRESLSIPILSQRFRARVLNFYRSFGLDPDAYAFISAITLGYKADLPDNLQEAFRASGTAHVLAVSGLHVGIIYLIINLMFSFLGKHGRRYMIRQWLVIIVLWWYVFVAGMSASIVRAAIMLTIYCLSNLYKQRGFSYNTLAAAAFFMLIYRPFSLYEVSFQMSFGAVFAILFFQPKLHTLCSPSNRVLKNIWNLLTLSISAQLGVFPLGLYYFGTFPTYFFITNLLVVPMVTLIIYAVVPLIVVSLPGPIQTGFIGLLQAIFQWIEKTLIEITLRIVYIAETLPFAQLSDNYISSIQLILLVMFIYLFAQYLFTHRPRPLIAALVSAWVFLFTITYENTTKSPPQLMVFNKPNISEIGLFVDNKRRYPDLPENGFIPHPEKSIFRLSDGSMEHFYSEESFPLDVLILSQYRYFNMEQLLQLFDPSIVVLDSSIPGYSSYRITKECRRLGVEVHDVTKDGAFSLNF